MRLGDLDSLKESIAAMDYLSKPDLDFICKAIENAPTVSDRYSEGYSQGYIDGSTGAIRGMQKNG